MKVFFGSSLSSFALQSSVSVPFSVAAVVPRLLRLSSRGGVDGFHVLHRSELSEGRGKPGGEPTERKEGLRVHMFECLGPASGLRLSVEVQRRTSSRSKVRLFVLGLVSRPW